MPSNKDKFQPSVRMGEQELKRVMEKLARRAERNNDSLKAARKNERVTLQRPDVPVCVRTGENEFNAYTTPMLDLSEEGVGLLFGRFVHPGSECRVALRKTDRSLNIVEGRVAWCEYYKGSLHRVGVKFDEPIDLAEYSLNMAMANILSSDDADTDESDPRSEAA